MLSFNLNGYYTPMNDEVNNPSHYNQNGIEVIEVIETYAKSDFRLANVLKYVCRCEYKGRKLQDLQKAAWYLNRVIEELSTTAPLPVDIVTSPDRIAGDCPLSKAIKADYYEYIEDETIATCGNCGEPILRCDLYLQKEGVNFCSTTCLQEYFAR